MRNENEIISLKAWLMFSREFYHAFKIEKSLGEQWFLLHEIALIEERCGTAKDIYSIMKALRVERGPASTAIKAAARECVLELFDGDEYIDLGALDSNKQVRNNVIIMFTPRFYRRLDFYGISLLRNVFGIKRALRMIEEQTDLPRQFVCKYYISTRDRYVVLWTGLLKSIAAISKRNKAITNEASFVNDMAGRTEAYLSIHIIIIETLTGKKEISQDYIYSAVEDIRQVNENLVGVCVRAYFACGLLRPISPTTIYLDNASMRINLDFKGAIDEYLTNFTIFFQMLEGELDATVAYSR